MNLQTLINTVTKKTVTKMQFSDQQSAELETAGAILFSQANTQGLKIHYSNLHRNFESIKFLDFLQFGKIAEFNTHET